jgi:hypothetical protein
MKTSKVPALVYGVACVGCRNQVTFPVFRASFFSFATYRGPVTKDFYRVDLEGEYYKKVLLEELLHVASMQRENGVPLELVPDGMTCPECGEPLGISEQDLRTLPGPGDILIEAVLI